ncbi:putative macrophage stimulating 1-like protein isoform X2 [Mercenaria mercenaria]|nr:putative macrophage stimulating 1-like protein isoform X2 [Mercenaria mercenaria]
MYGQMCDPVLKACVQKECLNATIPRKGEIHGNRKSVGDVLKFKCTRGYREQNGTVNAVCLETGQWDESAICVMDCQNPPDIDNGQVIAVNLDTANVACEQGYESAKTTINCAESVSWDSVTCDRIACGYLPTIANGNAVLDSVNSFYYTDTATVTCNDWYQIETNTIRCTIAGTWETASCIDCYPATPQEYIGRTNITKSGRLCQRWDSQSPHSHSYTDPQLYPDQSLAAANNYCRTPEPGDYDPWCNTMDPAEEWEYCNVHKCPWT